MQEQWDLRERRVCSKSMKSRIAKHIDMAKRSAAVALTLLLGLMAAIGSAQSNRSPGKDAVLTPQDYLDIQQLVSRYAYALDTGADNGYAYADLFAPDGEFVGGPGSTKGREALAGLGRLGFVDGRKPAHGVAHFIMNHVIHPSPEGAVGKQYLVLVNIGEGGKPGGEFSNIGGHYEDVYTKTSQGWRFKRREFIPSRSEPRPNRPGPAR